MGIIFLLLFLALIGILQLETYGKPWAEIQSAIMYGNNIDKDRMTMEERIRQHITMPESTPYYKAYLDAYPNHEAFNQFSTSSVALSASEYLALLNFSDLSAVERGYKVQEVSLEGTDIEKTCRINNILYYNCSDAYRSIDGTCNNVFEPNLGKSTTAYRRILFPEYANGINAMSTNNDLASARKISSKFANNNDYVDDKSTLAVMVWGQFVANDLSQTVVKTMENRDPIFCCNANYQELEPSDKHPYCESITIPQSDPVYGPHNITCMSYVRSATAIPMNCSFGPAQQMNQATHYLDASMIYGSNEMTAHKLREFTDGKLRMTTKNNRDYLADFVGNGMNECNGTCYASGDARVNDQPQVTAIYTIWVREHNRIAKKLKILHPNWGDETLYQEARRIVIAEIQHITYNEWLPQILSQDIVKFINSLNYTTYATSEVYNEVATAVLRFINSLVRPKIDLVNEEGKVVDILLLSENYFNPRIIETNDVLDSLLRGLATQHSGRMDIELAFDLTSKYYSTHSNVGLDIFSLDIQRGRDHGFPKYNKYRKWCEYPAVETFNDLRGSVPTTVVNKLKLLYRTPHDIDLIVGLFAEHLTPDTPIGYTLECILANQFSWTKLGDRYFYDNPRQPYPFLQEQLNELKKVSLARIICDNSDNIQYIQPNVFRTMEEGNKVRPCSKIYNPQIMY